MEGGKEKSLVGTILGGSYRAYLADLCQVDVSAVFVVTEGNKMLQCSKPRIIMIIIIMLLVTYCDQISKIQLTKHYETMNNAIWYSMDLVLSHFFKYIFLV